MISELHQGPCLSILEKNELYMFVRNRIKYFKVPVKDFSPHKTRKDCTY